MFNMSRHIICLILVLTNRTCVLITLLSYLYLGALKTSYSTDIRVKSETFKERLKPFIIYQTFLVYQTAFLANNIKLFLKSYIKAINFLEVKNQI